MKTHSIFRGDYGLLHGIVLAGSYAAIKLNGYTASLIILRSLPSRDIYTFPSLL